MKINEKILRFFSDKGISQKEIAESYGISSQNMSNIFNRDSGKVPFEFLVWLAEHHPELDLNALLRKDEEHFLIRESSADYKTTSDIKNKILKDISKILDKNL